ncbi:hypothetical protein BJ546DRAFT_947274 [Cryomyces antarcticus]
MAERGVEEMDVARGGVREEVQELPSMVRQRNRRSASPLIERVEDWRRSDRRRDKDGLECRSRHQHGERSERSERQGTVMVVVMTVMMMMERRETGEWCTSSTTVVGDNGLKGVSLPLYLSLRLSLSLSRARAHGFHVDGCRLQHPSAKQSFPAGYREVGLPHHYALGSPASTGSEEPIRQELARALARVLRRQRVLAPSRLRSAGDEGVCEP